MERKKNMIKMTVTELVAYRAWINAQIAEAKKRYERAVEDLLLPAELDGAPVLSSYIRGEAFEVLWEAREAEISRWWSAWFDQEDAQDDAVVTEALKQLKR